MAGQAATLLIKVVTDASQGQKGLDQSATKVGKLQGALGKMVVPAAAAGAAVLLFGKSAVDAASRTQQAMGAVDTVFGRNAGQVKKWASDAAQSLGLAKSEYGELASTLGASLKNMGVPMNQLAGQTNDLVKLGADLSATYGGTTKEAVEALGSALRGETDPIERYGIGIKQADIAARMAADGTDKLTGKAEKQAKTQALLSMVTEQSGKAVGAFARESDTAAGQAQRANAEWENSKAAIGQALLPMVTSVTKSLAGLAKVMGENAGTTRIVLGVILAIAAAILVLNVALKTYQAGLILTQAIQNATWLSNPIFLVIAAVLLLVGGFVLLYKKSATFKAFVDGMWAGIKAGVRIAAQVFRAVWQGAVAAVRTYLAAWRAYFTLIFNVIRGVVKAVVAVFKGDWKGALSAVRGIVQAFLSFFRSIFNLLPGPVKNAARAVWSALQDAFSKIRGAVSGLASLLSGPFNAMESAVDRVVSAVQSLIDWISRIKIPDVGGLLSKIPGVGKAAPSAMTAVASPAGLSGLGGDPGLRAGVLGRSAAAGGGPTIIVQGALDPEAVARQIRRIVTGHDVRVGNVGRAA
jgi:hypothetical protein